MSLARYKILYILFLIVFSASFSGCKTNTEKKKPEEEFIKKANDDQLNERIKVLSKEIEKEPEADLFMRRAKVYEALSKLELAKADVEGALKLDSSRVDYYIYAGKIYEKLPYIKGAIQAYEEAIRKQPKNKEILLKLGELFYYIKNREKSFHYLNSAIGIDKYLPEAYYFRGLNFKETGKTDIAIRSLQTAVEVDPGYFEAYMQLGLLYSEKKDIKAAAYYRNAINLQPDNPRAYYARGYFYQEIDSNRLAIMDYEKMIALEPGDKNAHYNLGYNYYLLKDYKKAAEHFTEAINAEHEYAEAYYGRGLALKALGKINQASEDFKRANELDPLYNTTDAKKKPKPGQKSDKNFKIEHK